MNKQPDAFGRTHQTPEEKAQADEVRRTLNGIINSRPRPFSAVTGDDINKWLDSLIEILPAVAAQARQLAPDEEVLPSSGIPRVLAKWGVEVHGYLHSVSKQLPENPEIDKRKFTEATKVLLHEVFYLQDDETSNLTE